MYVLGYIYVDFYHLKCKAKFKNIDHEQTHSLPNHNFNRRNSFLSIQICSLTLFKTVKRELLKYTRINLKTLVIYIISSLCKQLF